MTIEIALFPELTAKLAEPYTVALRHMLERSPEAAAQCGRGNVETAFRLLRQDVTAQLPEGWGLDKERVLNAAWRALPVTYQASDIDPD